VKVTTPTLDVQLAQLEEVLEATELLLCTDCEEETLHVIDCVLLNVIGADEVEVRCLHCGNLSTHWVTD
jgi:hypothetical protein